MAPSDAAPRLTLYSRLYCHLCEEMIAALRPLEASGRLRLAVVDVDEEPALAARYGTRVPVLAGEGIEICQYALDPAALDAFLAKVR